MRTAPVEKATRSDDFDAAVEAFREALETYLQGDPTAVTALFSRGDDVTLANPLGPPRRGPVDVEMAIAGGAAQLRDGAVRGFEEISRYSTPDLGYIVQVERTKARLAGSERISLETPICPGRRLSSLSDRSLRLHDRPSAADSGLEPRPSRASWPFVLSALR
jgi:ketosteroid isomerase-like protein